MDKLALYKSIEQGIKKSLRESLFDDDLLSNDESIYDNKGLLKTSGIERVLEKTLLRAYKIDGNILLDPSDSTIYYIMKNNYKHKKKKDIKNSYNYIIEFNEEGTIDLSLHVLSDHFNVNRWYMTWDEFNFISLSPVPIRSFTLYTSYNDNIPLKYIKMYKEKDLIWSDKFIKNFPYLFSVAVKYNTELFNNLHLYLYDYCFSNMISFITFTKKMVDAGFIVEDNKNRVFDKDNIQEIYNDVISGNYEKKEVEKKKQKELFIIKQLGQNHVDKLLNIINFFSEHQSKKVYLKSFNTLRTVKICTNDTIKHLLIDNDNNSVEIEEIDDRIFKKCLYASFKIMENEHLKSYACKYDYEDFINGVNTEYSIYTKTLNINDLPIILNGLSDIYTLYYVLGKGITLYISGKDMYDFRTDELNDNFNFDINTFDYTYLNNLFRQIIDKTIKKYKI